MATNKGPLTQRAAWKNLQSHYRDIQGQHLRPWFAEDPTRGDRLTAEAVGIYLDYSKNRVTDETLRLLIELAEQSDLRGRIDAMFRGEGARHHRKPGHGARWHCARPRGATIVVDGENVVQDHVVSTTSAEPASVCSASSKPTANKTANQRGTPWLRHRAIPMIIGAKNSLKA